jgi:hypothetical protein
MKRESVILCEGFHDRAFWAGLLKHLGCVVPQDPAKPLSQKMIRDPWGTRVAGGQFGYHSKTQEFVRVIPCGGETFLPAAVNNRLVERTTRTLRHLVVTYDADTDPGIEPTATQGIASRKSAVLNILKKADPGVTTNAAGDFLLDGGNTVVSVVVWWAPDAPGPGLPAKHTLERIACAALAAAFPGRAQAVEQWLQSRPGGPQAGNPKEYAWSNMAGWYADQGCEAFYSELWNEPQVATELQSRLATIGAWRIGQALAV